MPTTKTVREFKTREEFVKFCKAANTAFLDAHRGNVYLEYVREEIYDPGHACRPNVPKRGRPHAVFLALKGPDGTLSMGWSAAYPGSPTRRADRFDKAIGLWKAIRRATGQGRLGKTIPDRLVERAGTAISLTASTIASEFMNRAAEELEAKY